MTNCHAIQYSDEMHCAKCRLRWDVNDSEFDLHLPCAPKTESGVPAIPSPSLAPVVATRAHDEDAARSNRFVSALAPDRWRK